MTLKAIKEAVRCHFQNGKSFKAVSGGDAGETNVDAEFLFAERIDMGDKQQFPKGFYIKVNIIDNDVECPAVEIVSAHD